METFEILKLAKTITDNIKYEKLRDDFVWTDELRFAQTVIDQHKEIEELKYGGRERAHTKFIEIIAHHIDTKEQFMSGINPERFDHERWKGRYTGKESLPPKIVQWNVFKPEVDSLVSQLIKALSKDSE